MTANNHGGSEREICAVPEQAETPPGLRARRFEMTMFGYTWEEIKQAQQGGSLARRLPPGLHKPLATPGDWELLSRYGADELRNRAYYGVLDRLENTRLAMGMPDCDRSACNDYPTEPGQ